MNKSFKKTKMSQMNLKTGEVTFARKRSGGWLGASISSAVIILMVVFFWYLYSTKNKLIEEKNSLKNEIALQERIFDQANFWAVYDFESRLQVIGELLKNKSQPTQSLRLLSEKTLAETIFKELNISFEDGKSIFKCRVVVPSYSFLAKQVEAYRLMNGIIEVGFDSGTVTEEGVESVIGIVLNEKDEEESGTE